MGQMMIPTVLSLWFRGRRPFRIEAAVFVCIVGVTLPYIGALAHVRQVAFDEIERLEGAYSGYHRNSSEKRTCLNLRKVRPGEQLDLPLLFYVNAVSLEDSGADNESLRRLRGLADVEHLSLRRTSVTDAGLFQLRSFTDLVSLDLSHTPVTEAGLVHLTSLKKLEMLDLSNTSVTPTGLAVLKSLPKLWLLNLRNVRLSADAEKQSQDVGDVNSDSLNPQREEAARAKLRRSLPGVDIRFDG